MLSCFTNRTIPLLVPSNCLCLLLESSEVLEDFVLLPRRPPHVRKNGLTPHLKLVELGDACDEVFHVLLNVGVCLASKHPFDFTEIPNLSRGHELPAGVVRWLQASRIQLNMENYTVPILAAETRYQTLKVHESKITKKRKKI